jgi:phytoene dehydrogenase-like protein
MKNSVIIFGGGISGLTVAHELLDRGYDVMLVEKNDALGGMARSRRERGGYRQSTHGEAMHRFIKIHMMC